MKHTIAPSRVQQAEWYLFGTGEPTRETTQFLLATVLFFDKRLNDGHGVPLTKETNRPDRSSSLAESGGRELVVAE